jgi:hypothetical protein
VTLGSILELVGPALCCAVAGWVLRWLVLGITLYAMWRLGIEEKGE